MSGSATPGEPLAIVVDLGTGGPKIGFATLRGEVVWSEHHLVDTTFLPGGRGAEQDAENWWQLITSTVKRAFADGVVAASDIRAVAITGQWASTIPVDAAGLPVGPCIMWMDTRGGKLVKERFGGPVAGYAPRAVLEFVRRSGGAPSLDGADPLGHRLYVQRERPELFERTRWVLEPVDYLSMRFTGVAAASPVSMLATWLLDTRDPGVLRYDDKLVDIAGIDASKLPPLQRFMTVIGEVSPEVTAELGLPSGVQVVTGSPDLHSAAMGSGAVGDGEGHLAVSTTGWISCPIAKKKTDILHSMTTAPGLTPDRYLVIDNQDTAGRAFQWLRDTLGDGASYDELTDLASEAPAGSGGVIFTPWLNGERSPITDRAARGGFHNISLTTSRSEMVRAVLEGVAYNQRWLLDTTEKFVGSRLDPLRMIGGGAASDVWCQIYADVFDRTIEQVADPLFCGLRGAALIAGVALGEVRLTDLRTTVKVKATYSPNAGSREVLDRQYAQVPKLYSGQKKVFAALNRGRS